MIMLLSSGAVSREDEMKLRTPGGRPAYMSCEVAVQLLEHEDPDVPLRIAVRLR